MTVLTLQPAATAGLDTWIGEGGPTWNNGIDDTLTVQAQTGDGSRALLKFDLSSIPTGALVSSAVLTLTTTAVEADDAITIGAHRALTLWYEGEKDNAVPGATDGSTWNLRNANTDGTSAWGAVGGLSGTDYVSAATADASVTVTAAAYTWDLTTDVQHMVDGTTNYGWWMIASTANVYKQFASSDHGTAASRPKLVVTYTTPGTSAITWAIEVLWDGSNMRNEAEYAKSIRIERGRDGPLDETRAGKCVFVLDNYTDRFNPWNAAGALYGYLYPGKFVSVTATYHGNNYLLFTGYIEDIVPAGKLGDKTCTITAYDGWHQIKTQTAEMALVISSQTNDVRLAAIDTAIGIPNADYDTDKSCALFWANKNAGELIQELVNSEFGYVWVRPYATSYTLKARGAGWAGRGNTTIGDGDLTDIAVNRPWDLICNKCRVTAQLPYLTAEMDVWKLEEVISIPASSSVTLWAPYTDSNGQACTVAQTDDPDAGTDYTANAQADGGGADMTTDLTIAHTDYTESSKLVLTNGNVTTALYVTLCKLAAVACMYKSVTYQEEDATSKTAYGTREQKFSLRWLQKTADAKTFAEAFVAFWKTPQVMPVITMQRKLPLMLRNTVTCDALDLFDLVTFSSAAYGITSSTFLLGRITYWTENGMQDLRGEFQLEPFT